MEVVILWQNLWRSVIIIVKRQSYVADVDVLHLSWPKWKIKVSA